MHALTASLCAALGMGPGMWLFIDQMEHRICNCMLIGLLNAKRVMYCRASRRRISGPCSKVEMASYKERTPEAIKAKEDSKLRKLQPLQQALHHSTEEGEGHAASICMHDVCVVNTFAWLWRDGSRSGPLVRLKSGSDDTDLCWPTFKVGHNK